MRMRRQESLGTRLVENAQISLSSEKILQLLRVENSRFGRDFADLELP